MTRKTKLYLYRTITGVLFAFFGVLVSAKDPNNLTRGDAIGGIFAALTYLKGVTDKNPEDVREEGAATRATDIPPAP